MTRNGGFYMHGKFSNLHYLSKYTPTTLHKIGKLCLSSSKVDPTYYHNKTKFCYIQIDYPLLNISPAPLNYLVSIYSAPSQIRESFTT